MFDFDKGNEGSQGPWLSWSARGTQDGEIPAKSFALREENGKSTFDGFKKGVVMDIHNMKTGWQQSEGIVGVAPDWKWNASVSKMEPIPAGDGWKKGFQIPCAIGGGNTATWEQAGAAAWLGFTALVPAFSEGPDGKLPMVRLTGARLEQFKRGSTQVPLMEVVKWVDRPDCLKADAQNIDTGDGTAKSQKTPPPADDDDEEF